MNRPNILVLINGQAGVGKDTFVTYAEIQASQKHNVKTFNLHRSDMPKAALYSIGWDGNKDEESRELLKHMVEFMENKDLLGSYLERKFIMFPEPDTPPRIIFWHVREPDRMYELIDKYIDTDYVMPISLLLTRDVPNLEPDGWWDINNADYMVKIHLENDLEASRKSAAAFVDFLMEGDFDILKGDINGSK